MANTYTVKKGDTLSAIASKYKTTVANLVKLNNIKDPDYIVIGQVIKLDGTATTEATNKTSKANISLFGIQSNTERTMYVTWTWSKDNTENYQAIWYYDTGDGVWFVGSDSTENHKQSVYDAPDKAKRVKFKVKPISKTRMVNNKETTYWTASWSTEKIYTFSAEVPEAPPIPTVKFDKYKLTAELNNVDVNASLVQFQVVKNNLSVCKTGTATVSARHASFSCTVAAGAQYKVRCRNYGNGEYSEWSDYSENITTIPAAVSEITTCKANSKTSVYLEWEKSATAKTYDVEYTTKKEYFDGSDQTTVDSDIEFNHYEKAGLETGEEYFFRVRAVNDEGVSAWSDVVSVAIGKTPVAPTTWSSTTTVVVGDSLILYWVHNAEDGSSQTYAELELITDGDSEVHTIQNTTDEDEKDKTSSYTIDTSEFVEGSKIQWRVRTAGITKTYGEWSVQRTVDIYAPPTLELNMTDVEGDDIEVLTSFPFYIRGLAGPNTQAPIGYHVVITANEAYETNDLVGNTKFVNKGEQVYSKYFDTSDSLLVELSANSVNLDNNMSYTLTCMVSMNSGLTAESSLVFTVLWTDLEYEPNAEISIDKDTLVAYIRPYCEDDGDDITLSVYRREFDGTFTEIASGIENNEDTFITDPHPALDYARYRVVATAGSTGSVSYYDVPGYPVGETAAIIQWDEDWGKFDTTNEDEMETPTWSGSMVKFPYNIDVDDKRSVDVALIEYIGRSHPVSYYGTQLGESSSWSMEIPKSDKELLYGLRRLSIWKGDVYVREPSGSGYWANVTVSFSQKHCEVTIPVTLDIVRVEGGV